MTFIRRAAETPYTPAAQSIAIRNAPAIFISWPSMPARNGSFPEKSTTAATPKDAALEMPTVYGETSGLRVMPCITVPHRARPAPAKTAMMTRGMRSSQTILVVVS